MTTKASLSELEEDELDNPYGNAQRVLNSLTNELTVRGTVEIVNAEDAP